MKTIIYEARRYLLKNTMVNGDVIVLASRSEVKRSNDTSYKYRQDSNFFYLTGLVGSEKSIWVISMKNNKYITNVYLEAPSEKKRLWEGSGLDMETYEADLDVDSVKNIENIEADLKKINKSAKRIISHKESMVRALLGDKFDELDPIVKKMRLIKEDVEINIMKEACAITAKAFKKIEKKKNKFKNERDIEALVSSVFLKNSAIESYNTIVASGANANVLHYDKNQNDLKNCGLILVDAGCEYKMYASDVSRTIVLNSATPEQREIYRIVLLAQEQTLLIMKPGVYMKELKQFARAIMINELMGKEIIREEKTVDELFPHGIGHYIGLDVHDPCPYKDEEENDLPLEENMVVTIEPGIYIGEHQMGVPENYRGIGVRIEDVVQITNGSYSVLTKKIKK